LCGKGMDGDDGSGARGPASRYTGMWLTTAVKEERDAAFFIPVPLLALEVPHQPHRLERTSQREAQAERRKPPPLPPLAARGTRARFVNGKRVAAT
jgi:hypothetical protein